MTLTASNAATAGPRIDLLEAQAAAGDCDLVAKTGSIDGIDGGFLYGAGSSAVVDARCRRSPTRSCARWWRARPWRR